MKTDIVLAAAAAVEEVVVDAVANQAEIQRNKTFMQDLKHIMNLWQAS